MQCNVACAGSDGSLAMNDAPTYARTIHTQRWLPRRCIWFLRSVEAVSEGVSPIVYALWWDNTSKRRWVVLLKKAEKFLLCEEVDLILRRLPPVAEGQQPTINHSRRAAEEPTLSVTRKVVYQRQGEQHSGDKLQIYMMIQ